MQQADLTIQKFEPEPRELIRSERHQDEEDTLYDLYDDEDYDDYEYRDYIPGSKLC